MRTNRECEDSERQFGWLPEPFFCGAPDQRCRYCSLPILFVPSSLEISVCTCGRLPEAEMPIRDESRFLKVKFERTTRFGVAVNSAKVRAQLPVLRTTRSGLGLARRSLQQLKPDQL